MHRQETVYIKRCTKVTKYTQVTNPQQTFASLLLTPPHPSFWKVSLPGEAILACQKHPPLNSGTQTHAEDQNEAFGSFLFQEATKPAKN